MAGFNRDLILQGVRDELERATHTTDRLYDKSLAEWQAARSDQIKAKQQVGESLAAALDAIAPGDPDYSLAAVHLDKIARYSNSALSKAAQALPAMPQRKSSHRERALENVIAIIESHSEPTVTIADLRALGVLEYVRVPKDIC